MPNLGKYATEVLSAYGISLALIFGLLAVTLIKGQRARKALARVEAEQKSDG